jgi:hypothetical protein
MALRALCIGINDYPGTDKGLKGGDGGLTLAI